MPDPVPLAPASCIPAPSDHLAATMYLTMRPVGWATEPARAPASERERRILALALRAMHDAMTAPDTALSFSGPVSLYRGRAVPGTRQAPAMPAAFTVEGWDEWRRGRAVLEPSIGLRVVLHGDGRLTAIERTTTPSVMPGLERSLLGALERVGSANTLAGLLAELRTFRGWSEWGGARDAAGGDSLQVALWLGLEPDSLLGSWPLLAVRLPVYDSAALPASLPGNPPPRYPVGPRGRGESGEVLAAFVVGADGQMDRSTFRVLRATSPEFARAVEAVVPRYRFMAAEANGCALPMQVQLPFKFDVLR